MMTAIQLEGKIAFLADSLVGWLFLLLNQPPNLPDVAGLKSESTGWPTASPSLFLVGPSVLLPMPMNRFINGFPVDRETPASTLPQELCKSIGLELRDLVDPVDIRLPTGSPRLDPVLLRDAKGRAAFLEFLRTFSPPSEVRSAFKSLSGRL
mmetsp:Transcript_7512/g.13673  ORF Transcript_7512/g.13673 Transcript_7512/m.13673 type:complete len:152 (-) Transcript_7512:1121-1576(-)